MSEYEQSWEIMGFSSGDNDAYDKSHSGQQNADSHI